MHTVFFCDNVPNPPACRPAALLPRALRDPVGVRREPTLNRKTNICFSLQSWLPSNLHGVSQRTRGEGCRSKCECGGYIVAREHCVHELGSIVALAVVREGKNDFCLRNFQQFYLANRTSNDHTIAQVGAWYPCTHTTAMAGLCGQVSSQEKFSKKWGPALNRKTFIPCRSTA